MHYAARFGDVQTLGILSEVVILGVSPDCTDSDGRTPLEAFDIDRPSFIVESEEVAGKNRKIVEHFLCSVKMNLFFDSDQSDIDVFFDAVSSLEASVASLSALAPLDHSIDQPLVQPLDQPLVQPL